ncbi:hypothetical protein HNQ60_005126 [Povalibacter uvarum]|uniref:Polyketide cyclase/dehydrase/lipid transport protein n=1 Tax=Povalibacter uvarum TaxID=732238 RepID=A0A841HU87_9GAMM|nr:hypothetical protein [Povalibacter uvarum]MBB6096204.1 hypothetical protein [Povalibacter uvarum]
MRTFEYRFHFAMTLFGLLLNGQSLACEPPAGFVNPPRPEIAPLEQLMSHAEQREIPQPLAVVLQSANRPLRIDPTKDLPGVSGTFRLSDGPYGSVGARRLVCLTDGSTSVEEVLNTDSNSESSRFRYVVWNHTNPKFRNVAYAVGEFVRTQPAPDRTTVTWTYRFALKSGLSIEEKSRFQKIFLEQEFAGWMRTQMDRAPSVPAPKAP